MWGIHFTIPTHSHEKTGLLISLYLWHTSHLQTRALWCHTEQASGGGQSAPEAVALRNQRSCFIKGQYFNGMFFQNVPEGTSGCLRRQQRRWDHLSVAPCVRYVSRKFWLSKKWVMDANPFCIIISIYLLSTMCAWYYTKTQRQFLPKGDHK